MVGRRKIRGCLLVGLPSPVPSQGRQSCWGWWSVLGERPWGRCLHELREGALLGHRGSRERSRTGDWTGREGYLEGPPPRTEMGGGSACLLVLPALTTGPLQSAPGQGEPV